MIRGTPRRSGRWVVRVAAGGVALLLGTVVGCNDDRGEEAVVRGSALTSPIVDNGVRNTFRAAIETPVVAIALLEHFKAQRDIVVESVAPLRATDALEVLTIRMKFVYKKGDPGFRGIPGAFCTRRWPPVRFVDLLEAPVPVEAGDQIAVTVFARARAPGDHELTGVRIRYRQDGVLKEQTTESTTVTVVARDSKSELPESAYCPPDVPHHELGEVAPNTPTTAPGSDGGDGHDHTH